MSVRVWVSREVKGHGEGAGYGEVECKSNGKAEGEVQGDIEV